MRLPLSAERIAHSSLPSVPAAASIRAARGVRVLVVDDNVDAAESLGMLLTVAGQDVMLAHDGEAALAMALAHAPQVVLLDIGLPLLDGYEVARRLRRHPDFSDVVIVAITGYGHARNPDPLTNAGFDHYLLKPVNLAAVTGIIDAVAR